MIPQQLIQQSLPPTVPAFLLSAASDLEPPRVFEPILPDTPTLVGFGSIALLSAVAVWVWANQVVPVSRTNLALSKRDGPVREYLDELDSTEDRGFEQWLFTGWLVKPASSGKGGRKKEAALPILKSAKWNSGDNPVLAASALILLGVTLSAVLERVGSMM